MTYDRHEQPAPQPQPERPNLNLIDVHGGNQTLNGRIDSTVNSRNDNANNNNNRNDNTNLNNNNNRNDNVNNNNNRNVNDNRSNANANSNSRSDANANSNSNSRSDANATGGNATGGNARSDARGGNSNISDNSRTTYYGGSASAPNVYSSGMCSEGGSAGFYVLGIGVSGGKTTINESCMKKEDFQRTMTQVCRSSDEKAQVALQGFDLQLRAGRELESNPMANSVGMSAKRVADAKASVSLQLDSVCSTMANTADGTLEAMKRAGIDKPIIIPAEASNPADQRKIDEAVAQKLTEIDKRVKKVEEEPRVLMIQNDIYNKVEIQQPKPVHRPPSTHRPHPPAVKKDDCKDEVKK
ncbi:MAG: hypothetical protein QG625_3089 [Cyanobacteriota bacterium erpe_2018_sw_39hr_WHONDRS-SW48-000098_B_bin.30]|jgi:hypothetical protein|nr:hypothetical protein [Candidatus Obscuribacter sp.]MBK9202464.1 hypothetical protein [Candidatus Obscuribacter sp.]MBK9618750.1 hypothetical protein [Candidatus Obscuribacter sp.]MDQ5966933.1 hypothetical protein [Cyanobacteriota bacterium erpe_2018_sw_39hr_WHONDRS-SW48-000098_B_bin.30]